MAELMGICGAPPDRIRQTLDHMARHVSRTAKLLVDRYESPGLGLLRFHHGVINAGPQPVFNEDGSMLAALEGELFDQQGPRRELARAGHRFRHEAGDAELALHLYEQEGEAAFGALRGSYAIVLYALPVRRLLIVTDRFFSRPIFYCRWGEALAFSSRFNALMTCGALDGGRLDMTGVMQFFTFQHAQYESTFYQEAKAMLPASVLDFEAGRLTQRRYWRLRYDPEPGSAGDFAERLTEGLRAAARRMTCDAPRKGVMLSGGVDSRLVAAAADRRMAAYTVGEWENRELKTARRVAQAKGLRHVILLRPPDHYARILDDAVELAGGMARFDECQFLGLLDPVRPECDVLFIEDLMDALFKGHYWSRRLSVRGIQVPLPGQARFRRPGIEEQLLRLPAKGMLPSSPWLIFREPWRARYRDILYASIREQMADAQTDNPYNLAEHVGGLASLGRAMLNVSCVRTHLEYRALSLDGDLLELAAHTPVRYRAGGILVREALRRLDGRLYAIPCGNTGMRFDVPSSAAWAYRMAAEARLSVLKRLGRLPLTATNESWPDRGEVLRTPAFRSILGQTLCDPRAFDPSLFDAARLRQLLDEHSSRRRHHMRMLLCLLTFGRWFRQHGPAAAA